MECVKRGYELPEDTMVYVWTTHQPVKRKLHADFDFCTFVFDSKDEIWASKFTRKFWEMNPSLRPNTTLFDILY